MNRHKKAYSNSSLQNNIVETANSLSDVKSEKITYETLPFYYDPYLSFYQSLYRDDFVFEELTIKFSISASSNYEKAVFICNRLPNYRFNIFICISELFEYNINCLIFLYIIFINIVDTNN